MNVSTKHRWSDIWKGTAEDIGGTLVSVPILLPKFPLEQIIFVTYILVYGPDISVGIATDYGRDFPPVQTGPGAHTASCTMGAGSFPRLKYGRGVLLTTHPVLVPRSWKSRVIPLPTLWATTGPVTGTLYLYILVSSINTLWRVVCSPCIQAFGKAILWPRFSIFDRKTDYTK